MQPGVTPGAVVELHAARAMAGLSAGSNDANGRATWYDTSGHGNHAVLVGHDYTDTDGWTGDGSTDDPHRCVTDGVATGAYWQLPDLGLCESGVFTIEMYYKAASNGAYNAYLWSERDPATGHEASIRYWYNSVYQAFNNGTSYQSPGRAVAADQWHHLFWVRNGTVADLYVDSSSGPTRFGWTGSVPPSTTSSWIGAADAGAVYGSNLAKQVILVRAYAFPLTTDQIEQNLAVGYEWPHYPTRIRGLDLHGRP